MSTVTAEAPKVGDVLRGKYRLVRMLGEGGMGQVFEAVHERIGQRFAIKVLQTRFLEHPEFIGRFAREARAASQLRSANVARVIDVDETESGAPFMVLELLEGHDLAGELAERAVLDVEEAVDVLLQACDAMAEAHGLGIVHRDLKPSNLFIHSVGHLRVVKVLDFGISKITQDGEASVTMTQSSIGTPLYMSPEQIRSAKHVDARSDVWALGVILYECLAGRAPFVGGPTAVAASIVVDDPPSLRELAPQVPPELEAVVMRALAKRPDDRWSDVPSFAAALLPFAPESWRKRSTTPRISTDGDRVQIRVDAATMAATAGARTAVQEITSPPASASTAAPWSSTEPKTAAPTSKKRLPLVLAASAIVLCVGAAFALVRRSEPAPHPPPALASEPTISAAASPVPSPIASAAPSPSASVAPAPPPSAPAAKPTILAPKSGKPKTTDPKPPSNTTSPSPEATNPIRL